MPVEAGLLARPQLRAPLRVRLEHPGPIDVDDEPEVVVRDHEGDGFDLWIAVGGDTRTATRVTRW